MRPAAGSSDHFADWGAPAPDLPGMGACVGHAPEAFHQGDRVSEAKAVCGRCVVRLDCLAYALTWPVQGVWGGTTHLERAKALRSRQKRAQSMQSEDRETSHDRHP